MTNDAPKRIWLQCGGDYHAAQEAFKDSETGITWCVDQIDETDTQYTRADHAQAELQAAVAAEREACALVCDEYSKDHGSGMFDRHSNECANRIRARTDTDAQSALEAVKREARNEALREAAVNLKTYAPHLEDGPEYDVGYYHGYQTALNRILVLMEDTDDDKR